MIKHFYAAGTLLLMIIVAVGMHYTLGDSKSVSDNINAVAGLTKMSSPSFSVAYCEPRIWKIEEAANVAYPEMIPLDRMDFVYAK